MKEERPILHLERTPVETLLDMAALLAVAGSFALVIYHYGKLPDTIPTHFNAAGEADGFGSKSFLWFLPVLAGILVPGMIWLSRFPHKFNYPFRITKENAAGEYRRARVLIRVVGLMVAVLFLFLTWKMISGAVGGSASLGKHFLPVVLVGSMLPLLVYLFSSNKKK
jgi:uncharacterized membrane protein